MRLFGGEDKQKDPDRECYHCRWLSDKFVSICCNADSIYHADFVDGRNCCPCWEKGEPPEKPEDWRRPE